MKKRFNVSEFSKIKGVTPSAIRLAIAKGKIKAEKAYMGPYGFIWMIPRSELKTYSPRRYKKCT